MDNKIFSIFFFAFAQRTPEPKKLPRHFFLFKSYDDRLFVEMSEVNVVLITGITGQDGSYLAEEYLNNRADWIVYGIMRRASVFTTERIDHLWKHPNLRLRHGDMTDIAGLSSVVREIAKLHPKRFYVYNMAAQSHVHVSFETPLYTANVDAIGVLNLLEAIREAPEELSRVARVCQASTSEMYGKVVETPQSETTPFYPRSPYGVAKLYAYWIGKNYRESYGMHVCNSICFNHESERRGKTFVTRKITLSVAALMNKLAQLHRGEAEAAKDDTVSFALQLEEHKVLLGNLDAKRDWGHARDYVQGMIAIMDHPTPDDYVLATGETHSVREFIECAYNCFGLSIKWVTGTASSLEDGYVSIPIGDSVVVDVIVASVDSKYFRPAEVDLLLGDASKAKRTLGWAPRTRFSSLVQEMVEADLGCTIEHYNSQKIKKNF